MKSRILIRLAILAVALGSAAPARATSMVSMSMEQLAQASSDIVQARVVSQVSGWNATHTQIETTTTLEPYRKSQGERVVDDSSAAVGRDSGPSNANQVMGDVYLRSQGEYVLFLEPDNDSEYHVVGLSQGAYPIYEDAASHDERVVLPLNQASIQRLVSGGGNPAGTVPLVGFHKYVSSIVSAGIQIPHGFRLPVSIAYAESRGSGRTHVYGKTTAQFFPPPRW